jgi:hypothetical protein
MEWGACIGVAGWRSGAGGCRWRWGTSNNNDIDGSSEGGRVDILVVLVWGTDGTDGTTNVVHRIHNA